MIASVVVDGLAARVHTRIVQHTERTSRITDRQAERLRAVDLHWHDSMPLLLPAHVDMLALASRQQLLAQSPCP